MQKLIAALMVLAFAGFALGDCYTYTTTVTNGQAITYSDALPVSGYIDKIEMYTEAASTTTVTVATYGGTAGTNAVETFATTAIDGGTPVLVIPRRVGTTTAGVSLVAEALAAAASTNVGTIITVPYERAMVGGNLKVAVTGTANDGSCPVNVKIFYEPIAK